MHAIRNDPPVDFQEHGDGGRLVGRWPMACSEAHIGPEGGHGPKSGLRRGGAPLGALRRAGHLLEGELGSAALLRAQMAIKDYVQHDQPE